MKSKRYDMTSMSDRAMGVEPGDVLPDEIEYARTLLRERSGDVHGALYVVGLCGDASDAPLIEQYLHGPQNNVYIEVSLKALCRYLGLIDRYRQIVRDSIMSPPDELGFRRMAAIHLADKYFQNYRDDELGCELVRILCDLNDRHRSSARDALAAILGLEKKLKDPYGLDFDGWDDDATLLVEAARKRFHCPPAEIVFPSGTH